MYRKRFWIAILIAVMIITSLPGCRELPQEATPPELSSPASPPTHTPLPPTQSHLPPTHTPFPKSCDAPDSTVLEVINAFEILANDKNLEGTMDLFAENAVVKESFKSAVFDESREIEYLWQMYYFGSQPTEFRDVKVCGSNATFIWADTLAIGIKLWPVVIEVMEGKITYMDFYEDSTIEPLGND